MEDMIKKWIKQKRKEYKKEKNKWQVNSQFYYAFQKNLMC